MRTFTAEHFLPAERCDIQLVPRHIIGEHRRRRIVEGQAFTVVGNPVTIWNART